MKTRDTKKVAFLMSKNVRLLDIVVKDEGRRQVVCVLENPSLKILEEWELSDAAEILQHYKHLQGDIYLVLRKGGVWDPNRGRVVFPQGGPR